MFASLQNLAARIGFWQTAKFSECPFFAQAFLPARMRMELNNGLQDTSNDFEQVDSRFEELEVRITSVLDSRKSSSNPKNQTVESIKSEVRLPEIPIPTFSGTFSELESFKTQFTTLLSNNNLDDNQKLFYLRASLEVEDKQLESTEDIFNSLCEALKERFENERLLIDCHVLSILNYDKIQQESARELRSLIDFKKDIRGLSSKL
ncbi:hypothetical protein AVEN_227703-1 [Araneus ventricosus]|uniref:Uncharacterized protein n=1 Tax=Araneus ventricosus TaxID=182803 RepID=A0A4Y2P669_ARAVE|nr:hypothetical protein AVEN_227703-1 [Araneus ventricosus]